MSLVAYGTTGAVATITLQRPPVNALSAELLTELDGAIERAADPQVRAVVLNGTPRFCGGADITEFAEAHGGEGAASPASRIGAVVDRLEALPKPVVAAIRGFALGGGLELALGCDFRFLADDARVGQPEVKLGLLPGAGGTQRLTRLVGVGAARDIVYSGRLVEAAEAASMRLVDRVVPEEELDASALEFAAGWAEGPTVAIGLAKRAINQGLGLPIAEALEVERVAFDAAFASEDAREGVAAFLEKRTPGFSGR